MTVSYDDAERLRQAGFIELEIEKLSEATSKSGEPQAPLNLDGEVWQKVLQSRSDWIADKLGQGWTQEDIEAAIASYYARSPKRSPFDFLKAEYRPVAKRDFWVEVRRRSQNKVKATLGGYKFSTRFE